MPCENCNVQFTLFKHKKSCSECRRLFCLNCLERTRKRSLCSRCVIFNKRPLTRPELQRLRAKDLIVYLQSKHIPTAGCVEKDDLVNLVIAHVDSLTSGASPTSNSSRSSIPSPGSHYENFRSYFNNLTSQQQQSQQSQQPPSSNEHSYARQRSRNNSSTFFGTTTNGSADNPFNILRQGCQVILDNVTDKLATNFKFDPSPATAAAASSSSRNSSSPSSATSPSQSAQQRRPPPSRDTEWETIPRPTANEQAAPVVAPRPRPRVPLDTLRLSENGCECSDDEESKQQRTTSQSTSNLLAEPLDHHHHHNLMDMPGTSGCHRSERQVPTSRSKGSTTLSDSSEFSSFEELNAVTVEKRKVTRNEKPTMKRVQTPPPLPGTSTSRASSAFPVSAGGRVIKRRRSDGCLMTGGSAEGEIISRETKSEQKQKCCSRCGLKKNELRRRLKRFHDQLTTALSSQDVEVRQQLEALLLYLEGKRVSVVSVGESHGEESTSEPVIVNQPMPREEVPVTEEGEEEQPKPEKVVYKRRFVQLDEIKSSSDLEEFSVKQLKEILVLNRVDFKGCCEKKELIDRVRRLLDDYHACPAVDKLPTDDLCKICMDAPIECVILECGHMATCTSCGKVLSECPICRQFIIRVVRFFRA